ncbi:hypothetical protein V1292_004790 [Bradyrhizobium sp. AZCC 1719]
MSLPPLRFGSLICAQISPSVRPSQAIDAGARCHCGWAGHAGGIEIRGVVAGVAGHSGRSMPVGPAHHERLMRPHRVALQRPLGRRVAVHTTRMMQHLAGLFKERDRTRLLIGDALEARDGAQILRSRLAGGLRGRGRDENRHGGRTRREESLCAHHATALTNGRRRGRPRPSRAIAFATAGPIGGTPGSPTPVGFSLEFTTRTSTSGISWMRSTR